MMYDWIVNQVNTIAFVMVDASNVEVAGLGGTFSISIQKSGGVFIPGTGIKSEISDGWYEYVATVAESDTLGNTAIMVTGAGCVQQNLLAVVRNPVVIFPAGAVLFTYTLTNSVTLFPVEGAEVWFSTDNPAANIVWKGDTDVFGVARDVNGNLPALDVGVYFVWAQKGGYVANAWPDIETVSP